jgi:hypothetical protein
MLDLRHDWKAWSQSERATVVTLVLGLIILTVAWFAV